MHNTMEKEPSFYPVTLTTLGIRKSFRKLPRRTIGLRQRIQNQNGLGFPSSNEQSSLSSDDKEMQKVSFAGALVFNL